jgi:hypothetical protein
MPGSQYFPVRPPVNCHKENNIHFFGGYIEDPQKKSRT